MSDSDVQRRPPDQASGAELLQCKQNLDQKSLDENSVGFCYIEPAKDPDANPELLAECPESRQRDVRYAGYDTPKNHSIVYLACD